MRNIRRAAYAAAAAALLPVSAAAKVSFTGYADLRYNAGLNLQYSGEPATLSSFSLSPGGAESRSFSASALGLFASTQLDENLEFLMDLSFKGIGNTVGQTAIQYAYLNWTPQPDVAVRAGRITLPFGYLNENRFYAFQRYQITTPVFQSGILGLPIADWGASALKRWELSHFKVEAAAYVVNGYGHTGTTKDSLRAATLPGGLVLANNLRAADNNQRPSVGGRVQLVDVGGWRNEVGASYYWGDWDSSGLNPMYMVDVHAHVAAAGFDLLAESLHIGVRGDNGFAASIGSPNWTTDGGFATLSYDQLSVAGRKLAPYVQGELYLSRPDDGGVAREMMRNVTAGASYRISDHLSVKAEYLRLRYEVPSVSTGGSLRLKAEGALAAAVLTF